MTALLDDASVAVFLRYLERLIGFVGAAHAFAQAEQRSVGDLFAARCRPTCSTSSIRS